MANFHVIIPAAGAGSRMQSGLPKQYLSLSGKPVIQHTLAVFAANPRISSITLVLNPEDAIWDNLVGKIATSKLRVERCGGDTRAATVLHGLEALQEVVDADDWVLVHDAARPGLSTLALERLLDTLKNDEVGGLLAIPLADTLKRADSEQRVASTESRDALWQAQTPQMFRYGLLKRALQRTSEAAPTDEAQAIERFGLQPKLVQGELRNLKITYQQDLALLQAIFNADASENGDGNNMRIGHGFDVHQLVAGRKCILGGVDVPHEKGLQGHSDADVLLHAISDALLGAAGLGDIGKHFPDSEERYKGIDSRQLLRHVAAMLKEKQFLVVNIDATVIAEAPKLAPYITQMRAHIAEDCGIPVDEVNVKATTTERLGFTGRGEGIAAEAVCLIQRFHI